MRSRRESARDGSLTQYVPFRLARKISAAITVTTKQAAPIRSDPW